MIFLASIIAIAALAISLFSCVTDVRSMRIPNWHSLVIAGGFFVSWAIAPQVYHALWEHIMAGVLMLALTYILFMRGMIGGGDSKLGAALGLWTGLPGLMAYLFYMALAGGVLALFTLFFARKKPFAHPPEDSWMARAQSGAQEIPYGIAITVGAWGSLLHTGLISNHLNELSKIIH